MQAERGEKYSGVKLWRPRVGGVLALLMFGAVVNVVLAMTCVLARKPMRPDVALHAAKQRDGTWMVSVTDSSLGFTRTWRFLSAAGTTLGRKTLAINFGATGPPSPLNGVEMRRRQSISEAGPEQQAVLNGRTGGVATLAWWPWEDAAGWPMRSIACWYPGMYGSVGLNMHTSVMSKPDGGIEIRGGSPPTAISIPVTPLWAGFIGNTVVYATAGWGAVAGGLGLRARRRVMRGLCAGCGYDLKGLGLAMCPECGAPHSGQGEESGRPVRS